MKWRAMRAGSTVRAQRAILSRLRPLKLAVRSHDVHSARSLAFTFFFAVFAAVARAKSTSACRLGTEGEFDPSLTVIDAVVLQSTFPGPPSKLPESRAYSEALMEATATLVVLKSWKGHFRPGDNVKVAQPSLFGGCCLRNSLPVGGHFIIFAHQDLEPLEVTESSVTDSSAPGCVAQELDALTGQGQ